MPAANNNTDLVSYCKNRGSRMRSLVGLLLVAAAALKAVQLFTEPLSGLIHPPVNYLLPVQIAVELILGLSVLSGLYWHKLRWLVLAVFTGFAGYSLNLALNGATSCGCFGPVRVHPWWTLGLDLAVVVGLLFFVFGDRLKTDPDNASSERFLISDASRRYRQLILGGATGAAIIAPLLFRYADQRTAVAGGPASVGPVILEPEHWTGQKLPIADAVDADLSQGEWVVLLHRHDCLVCQEHVRQYEERAAAGEHVALVEVPPYGDFDHHGINCLYAKLRRTREWFVQTPVEIRLANGVVQAVKIHEH